MTTQLRFHEAANIFPMDEEHLEELAEDIRKNGQQVPIEVIEGKIIDGRRRFKACEMAGVKPITKIVKICDPIQYAVSLNLIRRHLDISQRAMIGARMKGMYEEQAKERQKKAGQTHGRGKVVANWPQPIDEDAGKSREKAGKAVNVGGRTITRAETVLEKGVPELVKAVDEGKIKVGAGERIANLSEEEQKEEVHNILHPEPKSKQPKPDEVPDWTKGKGAALAAEAIDILMRIPLDDPQREYALNSVKKWILHNK